MRKVWGLVHRYVGLVIAGFLIMSGLTGAVISWDHELDEVLNGHLLKAHTAGQPRSSFDLAKAVEQRHPEAVVTFIPLNAEPGHSLGFGVDGRVNPATGKVFEPGYNEVFVDPVSGEELGRREWGAAWPITRENFVSFLYVLHYSLHIPEFWGIDRWGLWLLGAIAVLWTLDCFVGFYLTLPRRAAVGTWLQRWGPAWKVRWRSGAAKRDFDLHRAFSLWTWGLLFVLAFTAFSLNLNQEIFRPVLTTISKVTPGPFDVREPRPENQPIAPKLDYPAAVDLAARTAAARGWDAPAGSVFYSPEFGIYGVSFFEGGDDHGSGGVGPQALYVDGLTGAILGDFEPWRGTAADIFYQAQFPVHSGRILGLPGRILISVMGVVVAGVSATGVIIWWRKRKARKRAGRTA